MQEATGETMVLIEWGRGVYVLTELNQLVISISQHENMQTYHAVDVLYEYLLGLPLAGPHFLIWL